MVPEQVPQPALRNAGQVVVALAAAETAAEVAGLDEAGLPAVVLGVVDHPETVQDLADDHADPAGAGGQVDAGQAVQVAVPAEPGQFPQPRDTPFRVLAGPGVGLHAPLQLGFCQRAQAGEADLAGVEGRSGPGAPSPELLQVAGDGGDRQSLLFAAADPERGKPGAAGTARLGVGTPGDCRPRSGTCRSRGRHPAAQPRPRCRRAGHRDRDGASTAAGGESTARVPGHGPGARGRPGRPAARTPRSSARAWPAPGSPPGWPRPGAGRRRRSIHPGGHGRGRAGWTWRVRTPEHGTTSGRPDDPREW